MNARRLRRAGAIASTLALAAAGTALADGIAADSDALQAGVQQHLDLGAVLPGSVHEVDVPVALVCGSLTHVAVGQTVSVVVAGTDAPAGGTISATGTSIGPVPTTWPASGTECGATAPLAATLPTTVAITAPAVAGTYAGYTVVYAASGVSGTGAYSSVTFSLTVDTPPTLVLPASPVVIEGDVTGGGHAAYLVTTADAEDALSPVPVCTPAPGALVPLGTTSVSCSATDSAGMSASGSFDLRVVDTVPPALSGVPGAISETTSDPAGAVVVYQAPTATDVVDPTPIVSCTPASGQRFPVGLTTVTCTATDASSNQSAATFDVEVALEARVVTPLVQWAPPVSIGFVDIRSDRTLPVRVALTNDGQPVRQGDVVLSLTPLESCPALAADAATMPAAGPLVVGGSLTWQQGVDRWSMLLDAAVVPGSPGTCTRADLTVGGVPAGFFVLRIVR